MTGHMYESYCVQISARSVKNKKLLWKIMKKIDWSLALWSEGHNCNRTVRLRLCPPASASSSVTFGSHAATDVIRGRRRLYVPFDGYVLG